MLKTYSKFLDVLEKIEKVILAVTVAVMIVVMVYQVILRYVFSAANSWSEELARYLFIYNVMIGSAIAIRRNSHLQVDTITSHLSPKLQCVFTIVATVLGMVFLVLLMVHSITLCQTGAKTMSAGLPISMTLPYASMPIGIVLMLLTSIEVVFKKIEEIRAMGKEANA